MCQHLEEAVPGMHRTGYRPTGHRARGVEPPGRRNTAAAVSRAIT
jgi:hypothetical protein